MDPKAFMIMSVVSSVMAPAKYRGYEDTLHVWACKDGRRSIGDTYVCDGRIHCTDGSDEDDVTCSKWNCTERYWKCFINNKCIPEEKVCDMDKNCIDRSDEADDLCALWNCSKGYWKCGSNECIPERNVCDGDYDFFMMSLTSCKDGSDEVNKLCSVWNCNGLWKCGSNECIPHSMVCDGNPMCADGSDENARLCNEWNCPPGFWKCTDGFQCVDEEDVCDSYNDCNDKSDEEATFCNQWICGNGKWKCNNNLQCISKETICDSEVDCKDDSDEVVEICEERVCPAGTWQCIGTSLCITHSFDCVVHAKERVCPEHFSRCADDIHCLEDRYWCDGKTYSIYGCPDGSDEGVQCEHWDCLPDYWKCADRYMCIHTTGVCDNFNDAIYGGLFLYGCRDGSDEDNRLCGCLNENEWPCQDGDGCVSDTEVCDGPDNCNDGSDEGANCTHWECPQGRWKCDDNLQCIIKHYTCNGIANCKDKSDEHNQRCGCFPLGYWPCHNGDGCVPVTSVCDGYDSCNDKSDELESTCRTWTCAETMFQCKNSTNSARCIPHTSLCDSYENCNDDSDENIDFCTQYNCPAGYTKCANTWQCIRYSDICDGKYDCRDNSDELCDSRCLRIPFPEKSVIRQCQEDSAECVPLKYYCDGVAHCPDASDEAQSSCTCKNWGLITCYDKGETYCLRPQWRGEHTFNDTFDRCLSGSNGRIDNTLNGANVKRESCIYVTMEGKDELGCLSYSSTAPCRTIAYPVNRGFSTICLLGTFHNISSSIELLSKEENANLVNIFCLECVIENTKVSFSCKTGDVCKVTLIGLTMRESSLHLNNVCVYFTKVNLEDVLIRDTLSKNEIGNNQIYFENSTFVCLMTNTSVSACGIEVNNTDTVKIHLTNSELFQFRIHLVVNNLMLTVRNVRFIRPVIDISAHSHEYLRIPAIVRFHKVTVTKFIDKINQTIRGKSLRIQKWPLVRSFARFHLVNPYMILKETYFSECNLDIHSPRLNFNQVFFSLLISKSNFIDSYHEGNGGGLSIRSEVQHSIVTIFSSNFSHNTAKKGLGNSKGSGGGLFVEAKSLSLDINGCMFEDNDASESGLALYTSEGVTSSLVNCSFHFNLKPEVAIKQTGVQAVLFTAGRTVRLNVYFHILNNSPETSVSPIDILYIGEAEQILTEIQCPNFYQHITQYTSKSAATHAVLDLRYECSPCSDNYYVKTLKNNILSHSPFGNNSKLNYLVKETTAGTCVQCPYGSICTGNNVLPRPNYWGFWHEGGLIFKQCPSGYCCPGSDNSFCTRYDYCAENRTGILCGGCHPGFSVSIFNGVCTPNSLCGGVYWFWLFAMFSSITYVLWYTFKEDLFALMLTISSKCRSLRSSDSKVQHQIDRSDLSSHKIAKSNEIPNTNVDEGNSLSLAPEHNGAAVSKGYFGIATYYIQMAAVIKIEIEFSDIDKSESFIDRLVENIGRFLNVELAEVSFDVCPITGLTTLGQHLYSLINLVEIYIIWAIIFVLVYFISKSIQTTTAKLDNIIKRVQSFKLKLIGGMVEIIKYTYTGFCGIIFKSLVCIKIGSNYVWWYDASNVCLENWQVLIIIFAVAYAIPLPCMLIFGLKLLRENKISSSVFLCCCICPMLSFYLILKFKCFQPKSVVSGKPSMSPSSNVIVSILQGPYKNDHQNMALYWEAMVSIRRLLITGMTLIGYASIQMIMITILSLVFLVQHIYISPFQVPTSNDVEALSLVLLCLTSVSNLLKASLTDSGVVPSGPSVQFFKSLELCEKMLLWIIAAYIMMVEIRLKIKRQKRLKNNG